MRPGPRPIPSAPFSRAALGSALAVALLGCWAVTPAAAKPPPDFFGVAPQSQLGDRDFELMIEDRVGIVRQLFLWAAIEPQPGEYSWGQIDEAVRRASNAGIRVFPVLYGTAGWAQSSRLNKRCGITCAPSSVKARKGFARFAAAAVARYGHGGTFWTDPPEPPPDPPPPDPPPPPPPDPCTIPPLLCRGTAQTPVEAWQVWNEQNSPKYHGPRVSVRRYADLLKRTGKAIRREDSRAEIVLGGMWGPPGTDSVLPVLPYLKQLYRVRGIKKAFDAIAVHPYAGRFSSVVDQLRGVRKLAKRVGDRRVSTWVTELGWASGGPKREPLVKTPKAQAALLRKSFRLLIRKRSAWKIRSVHWYSWRDTGTNAKICAWCPQSGLRTEGGDAKPAADAFRRLAG